MVLSGNDLPAVQRGSDGLFVDGANPELLRDLLLRWDDAIRVGAPVTWSTMRPGLSRETVLRQFDELGLPAPDEAIEWWTWRNGHQQGIGHALRDAQTSLEDAAQLYRESSLGEGFGQWNPAWIILAGEGWKWSISMRCEPITSPPLLRTIVPEIGLTTNEASPEHQALSMCTPVTLWLLAVENGWFRSNPETGWFDYRWEEIPPELRATYLI